jgi:hypothetical protein
MCRTSAPPCSKWVAHAWRSMWGEMRVRMPALFACHHTTTWTVMGLSRRPSRRECRLGSPSDEPWTAVPYCKYRSRAAAARSGSGSSRSLAALPAADEERPFAGIHVREVEADALRETDAGPVERLEQRTVPLPDGAEDGRRLYEPTRLRGCQTGPPGRRKGSRALPRSTPPGRGSPRRGGPALSQPRKERL